MVRLSSWARITLRGCYSLSFFMIGLVCMTSQVRDEIITQISIDIGKSYLIKTDDVYIIPFRETTSNYLVSNEGGRPLEVLPYLHRHFHIDTCICKSSPLIRMAYKQ